MFVTGFAATFEWEVGLYLYVQNENGKTYFLFKDRLSFKTFSTRWSSLHYNKYESCCRETQHMPMSKTISIWGNKAVEYREMSPTSPRGHSMNFVS